MRYLHKALTIGLTVGVLAGCMRVTADDKEVESDTNSHASPISSVIEGNVLDRDESWRFSSEEFKVEDSGKPRTHASLLGDIEMDEDWNPEFPTKRKEGVYRPGKQKDGVWYWEMIPRKSTKTYLNQRPHNNI